MCVEVVQGDLEELVEEEAPLHLTTGRALTWTRYHSSHLLVLYSPGRYHDQATMDLFFHELAARRAWVTVESIGRSLEGRDMLVLKVRST